MENLPDREYEVLPEPLDLVDSIALDALVATRPSPATVLHTAKLQYVTPNTPDTPRIEYAAEHTRLEQPPSDDVTNIELVGNLREKIIDLIGTGPIRVRDIMKELFGVPTIDTATFDIFHAELKRLRRAGIIARNEKYYYHLRQEPEMDTKLEGRMRNAGVYPSGTRMASSVNHRTGRSGVRRHK